ncbi:hypothetical protein ACFXAZ_18590 [Streptomyces sp. NPDC059477]|uniref:hypothetical protein n=1 Tax=Streptomyces sp. NPDC059477 TaxID=3346847 RepID=UPI0036846793
MAAAHGHGTRQTLVVVGLYADEPGGGSTARHLAAPWLPLRVRGAPDPGGAAGRP